MNTLDVCCALIELPAARGPLRGSPTGFFTNSPAEKWNQGKMPGTPSYGKYGKNWDAPSSPSACSPPYGTGSLNALSALSLFCAVWNFAPCPGPWNMGFFSRRTLEELPWAPADRLVLKEWLEEHR